MVQNHHHRIEAVEDIADHRAHQATVQAAAEVIVVAVAGHIVHHHQKNEKLNHPQTTWIKFGRSEHQHHQN